MVPVLVPAGGVMYVATAPAACLSSLENASTGGYSEDGSKSEDRTDTRCRGSHNPLGDPNST